jgi:hypothetical protein
MLVRSARRTPLLRFVQFVSRWYQSRLRTLPIPSVKATVVRATVSVLVRVLMNVHFPRLLPNVSVGWSWDNMDCPVGRVVAEPRSTPPRVTVRRRELFHKDCLLALLSSGGGDCCTDR